MARNRTCIMAICLALFGTSIGAVRAEDDPEKVEVEVKPAEVETHDDDDDLEHFKFYVGPAYVAPMGEEDVTFGTTTDAIESAKHVGWNFGFEGRFNRLLGIELDYVNSNQDVDFGGTTIGDANFQPLTATLNFHLIPTSIVDLYIGPSYTYVNWGDVKLNVDGSSITGQSGELRTDSTTGWGGSLGLDIGLGEHFAITMGVKYLDVDMDLPDTGQKIPVNPLLARLGVAVRF